MNNRLVVDGHEFTELETMSLMNLVFNHNGMKKFEDIQNFLMNFKIACEFEDSYLISEKDPFGCTIGLLKESVLNTMYGVIDYANK